MYSRQTAVLNQNLSADSIKVEKLAVQRKKLTPEFSVGLCPVIVVTVSDHFLDGAFQLIMIFRYVANLVPVRIRPDTVRLTR